MRLEKPAIPIRRGDHSETSQVVHLLAEDLGRVVCLARGAHRPGAAFGGPVDLLVVGRADLTLRQGDSLALLHGFRVTRPLGGLRRDPLRHAVACEMLEVVRALTCPGEDEAAWFPLLRASLETLEEASSAEGAEAVLAAFLARAVAVAGFAPELERCVLCGARIAERAGEIDFSDERGGVVCRRCARKERRPIRRVEPDTLAWIGRLSGSGSPVTRGDPRRLRAARRRLEEFLAHRLGGRLRSRSLVEEALER